jgi:homoserine dehydrogenase
LVASRETAAAPAGESTSASRELLATLRKGKHVITLEKRAVTAIGEELILSVNGHWRRMRVFWSDGHISIGRSDRCDR